MTDKPQLDFAETLYRDGMRYNWNQGNGLENSALARAAFERAAVIGHTKALREVAEMVFVGAGGPQDQEHALWLKWSAFGRGDYEALEELSALLESYSDTITSPQSKQRAAEAAKKVEEVGERLRWLKSYLHNLASFKLTDHNAES